MLLAGLLLAAFSSVPLEITLDPRPGESFRVVFTAPASKALTGPFRGGVSLNGSAVEMPLTGNAETRGGLLRLSAAVRYADVPADWLDRVRRESFEYRVRAEAAGETVSWSGTERWDRIRIAGNRDSLENFVKLTSLELTNLSLKNSEGRAVLAVTNPFSFPITLAATDYHLRVGDEEVGSGATRGRILRPRHTARVELPFTVQQWRFLAAAGGSWAVGGDIDAELVGSLTARLPSGDVSVPLDFRGTLGTDGARSGVFSHPDGVFR